MKSNNIKEKDFIYHEPSVEDVSLFLIKFNSYLSGFAKKSKLKRESILITGQLVVKLFFRIDEYKDNNLYFNHKNKNSVITTELNDLAIMCYWIIKYKPLFREKALMELSIIENDCTINEMFASFIIENFFLKKFYNKKNKIEKIFNDENIKNLRYNFMHREISKESMIMLVNSIYNALTKIAE